MTFWTWAHESPYLAFLVIIATAQCATSIVIGFLETIEIVSRGYQPSLEVKDESKR